MTTKHALALSRISRLVVLCAAISCCFAMLAQAADPPAADVPDEEARIPFAGTGSFGVTINGARVQSLWKRELMRQALLLAARAEMGYCTADNTLGDGISRSKPSLELSCTAGTADRIQLLKGPTGKREPVWTQEFKFDSSWPPHRAWVERMELMSRTVFVEALETAKFARRPAPRVKDAAAPLDPALVRMIDEDLSFCGQFLALRQLHAGMAGEGESAARLAGLVRAYAHLGLLTEYQWHPMSYAFKARALLYAQRWAVREPKSQLARQHRAYAFALVGMHSDALADLQAAAKLAGDSSAKSESPAWIALIEHYCRYDFEELNRLRADEHLKPLASLLYFLAHEQEGSSNLTIKVGLELIDEMPGCYRILDSLCHHTGPGVGHLTTQVGPRHLATTLLPRLEKVRELPPHVRLTLDLARAEGAMLTDDSDEEDIKAEIEYRAKVIAGLRGIVPATAGTAAPAADGIEPSWAVLAKLIEETTFLQLYRRAYFVRRQLGFPLDDYIDAHRPIVANHRRIAFLDEFHTQSDPQKLEAAKRNFDVTNLDFAQARLWVHWPGNMRLQVENVAKANKEGLPNEAGLAARSYHYDVNIGLGPLLAVSPHSPYAMGVALRVNSQEQPEAEKAWEEVAKRSPYLAWSLSEVWTRRGNRAKAERYLKMAAELDPSPTNYRKLADHYKVQGDEENWLKSLNDFLKTPSLGLEHAQVQCEIAQYYANRREWDKALPYADAASETGAQWAMSWASTVNEANQNWDETERLQVAAIQRYGEHPVMWYFFCQRNGCGQLDLARKAAFPRGLDEFASRDDIAVNYVALALVLEGQPKKALEIYEKESKTAPASWTTMMAATTADRVGDDKKRDVLLKLVVEQPPPPNKNDARPHREELVELARKLIADLATGGKCAFDFEKLHANRDRAPARDRCSFNFFLGCYLDRRGKTDRAVEYWKQCMGASDLVMSTRTLAGFELHERGVKPSEWKQLLFAKPETPK